ncbi:MAG: hypothetical protein HY543_06455, partial [Deltaproteobacteria bacterium]|nr:hypothetical protein [Deltaproteobacteria bacterium]
YNRVQIGAKVVVLPQALPATVAQSHAPARKVQSQIQVQQVSYSSGYAPESDAQRTWSTIRSSSIY